MCGVYAREAALERGLAALPCPQLQALLDMLFGLSL